MFNLRFTVAIIVLAAIVACCGGGVSGTLDGVAAVGAPIVGGNISVICAAGKALSTTTSNTGAWQLTRSGQTLPCAVEVTGGTINGAANTEAYTSIAIAPGTVNVTPLTDLLVANLVGTATPSTWFAGLSKNPAPLAAITQTKVNTALANLSTALSALTPLGTTNPITTSFTPTSGNASEDMLTALAAAIANSGVTYASLLSDASTASFTVPAGFGTALAAAYDVTPTGSASTTSTATGLAIVYNVAPNSSCQWTVQTGTNFIFIPAGLLDLSVKDVYLFNPQIENYMPTNLTTTASGGTSGNQLDTMAVQLERAEITYSWLAGGNTIASYPILMDIESQAPFIVPLSGIVPSADTSGEPGQMVIKGIPLFSQVVGDLFKGTLTADDMKIVVLGASVTIYGQTLGGDSIKSNEFVYPVSFCLGCTVDVMCCVGTSSAPAMTFCIPGQDSHQPCSC